MKKPVDLKPNELHLHHLAHDAKGTGWRVDLGHEVSIRIHTQRESVSGATKKALALRLAVCWNVLEGYPTPDLLDGVLRRAFDAADELATSVELMIGPHADGYSSDDDLPRVIRAVQAFRASHKVLAEVEEEVKCSCQESEAAA